jgi:hypothetical protein
VGGFGPDPFGGVRPTAVGEVKRSDRADFNAVPTAVVVGDKVTLPEIEGSRSKPKSWSRNSPARDQVRSSRRVARLRRRRTDLILGEPLAGCRRWPWVVAS